MGRIFPISIALAGAMMVAQSASAADLRVPPITKAPPLVTTLWGGPYVGVNLGYGWGNWDSTGTFDSHAITPSPDVNGLFGGAQAGYNWQFDRLVLGIEGDFQFSGISGSSDAYIPGTPKTCVTVTTASPNAIHINCVNGAGGGTTQQCTGPTAAMSAASDWNLNWFSTIRGRVGYTIDSTWLLYGTAGVAIADVETSGTLVSGSKVKAGWTVGGGIEKSFARNWTAKAECLYLDLGNETFQGSSADTALTSKIQEHIVRVGVNYHFAPDVYVARR